MKRRRLKFSSFHELLSEVDRLQTAGYHRTGQWSLTQICQHLRIFQDMSMDGFDVMPVSAWKRFPAKLAIHLCLWMRWMPSGVRAPDAMVPAAIIEDPIEIEKFRTSTHRLASSPGPFHPSPFFGQLSPRNWHALHLLHSAHHLRFLSPKLAPDNALMG